MCVQPALVFTGSMYVCIYGNTRSRALLFAVFIWRTQALCAVFVDARLYGRLTVLHCHAVFGVENFRFVLFLSPMTRIIVCS